MTKDKLEKLLHLTVRAARQREVSAAHGWYHRGRSIYEISKEGERRVASVEGPKTRSKRNALATLAESRAAFIAAFNPVTAKELVEEALERRGIVAATGPRELTNLLETTQDTRTALENELNQVLECRLCGHCDVCQSLRADRNRFDA